MTTKRLGEAVLGEGICLFLGENLGTLAGQEGKPDQGPS